MPDHFGGTFKHRVDAKGRVSLPSRLRKVVDNSGVPGDEVHMIVAEDKSHIIAYLASEVNRRLKAMQADESIDMPAGAADPRRAAYFSGSSSSICDSAGRIALHKAHLRKAGIEKECVFDGMGDYFVIYQPAAFVAMKRETIADYDLEEELG